MRRWLFGCLFASSAAAAPVGTVVPIDRSIAHVDDVVIWESELDSRAKGVDPKDRGKVLDEMIDDELVANEGRKAHIEVEKAEVMEALEEIKKQNSLDDAGLDVALKDAGFTRPRYLVELERQLLILRTKNQFVRPRVNVTNADIEAEAKKSNLPVTDATREQLRAAVSRRMFDDEVTVWVTKLRKLARIERRP